MIQVEKTKIKTYFSLYGDEFPIDCISNELNLEPTFSHIKGEVIPKKTSINIKNNSPSTRKETIWELGTNYEESLDAEEELMKVISRLKGKENKIIELKKKYNLQCLFMIVIIMNEGYTPAVVMNKEIIEFIHIIDAEVHFDLYANPYQFEL